MKKIKLDNKNEVKRNLPKPKKPTSRNFNKEIKPKDKSKGRKKKKWLILIPIILLIVAIAGGILYWRWDIQINNSATSGGGTSAAACTNILDPQCWTEAFRPQLDQYDGKTNALIVGVDTRESGSGAGLRNTDTILLATYYHETGESRLLSFPRDLYAPYGCSEENLPFRSKINAIYNYGETYCDSEDGMKTLGYTISEITGEEIQYTAIIRLEGVIDAVDELGGITIDVPEDYTDVYPYIELPPEEQAECVRARTSPGPGYCVYNFPAGETKMDGQTALIYARMRYWTNDFDRARRQQQVITAIKDKIVGENVPLSEKARNLLSLSSDLDSKVQVNKLDLDTILAGLDIARQLDNEPLKVVIDPEFGGGGFIFAANNNYNFSDYTFTNIQNELQFINENADLYRDRAKIYAVNHTGVAWTGDNPVIELRNGDYWFMEIITDTKSIQPDKSGVEIIDYTNGEMQSTVDELEERFAEYNVTVIDASEADLEKSSYGEDIGINIFDLETQQNSPTQTSN
jgi:anionic cell wall polymer biosynthesis LytR-Cps2A-Psr (LCP) family protein